MQLIESFCLFVNKCQMFIVVLYVFCSHLKEKNLKKKEKLVQIQCESSEKQQGINGASQQQAEITGLEALQCLFNFHFRLFQRRG